ncbi:MAG: aldo/keto reductase [Bacteroidales bacterium]|nr:aldo/keto reductase [Bacteroidales bacterium]
MTRREALKGLFFAGMGIAAGGMLLKSQAAPAKAGTLPAPWKEAPEGSKIDTRTWSKLGETLGMLGLGCMRLPALTGGGGGYGRNQPLDLEAVNAMVDYAIAHGINYFDTAPAYGQSEVVTGKALSRHPRSAYKIATKMSNQNGRPTLEAGKQMFETSLKNLQVDYVDFLLLHNVQNMSGFNTRFRNNGLFDWILEQKSKGRIKHLGFSFHGSNDDLPGLVDLYDWDFVQIQLNYADWKDMSSGWGGNSGTTSSEFLYNYLVGKGIPITVMEPIKGGALANVSDGVASVLRERHPDLTPAANALTFVGSLPGVMVTLSGMSNMEQLKENVSLFTDFKPFDDSDMAFMHNVADLYKSRGQIPCTACAYCMPCPAGVNIPGNFKIFNSASDALLSSDTNRKDLDDKRKAFLKLYNAQEKGVRADACVGCNACLPKCPQHISIPQHMERIRTLAAKI